MTASYKPEVALSGLRKKGEAAIAGTDRWGSSASGSAVAAFAKRHILPSCKKPHAELALWSVSCGNEFEPVERKMMRFINPIPFVRDINRSKDFYTKLLGLKIIEDAGNFVLFESGFAIHEGTEIGQPCDRRDSAGGPNELLQLRVP